ncbi:hypothetical protein RJT34_01915 [Clitoria ternatea]|uniref:Protein kinase domain-containing protein n=1 Tax=Clitoria ternatea TaxID=43366 RepID=A0AAN9Q0P9_CLITE
MNLIEMWGYYAEGKHKLLVCEYMENGSLAENLSSNTLDWSKRYNIALEIARGLAYLHEECLEWILHCDIKPQNILLDSNYHPKIADFGLSKLLNKNIIKSSFSMIRGTRGYMAPEWVFNLPITSKVDVYGYGIVLLELVTGKSPTMDIETVVGEEAYNGRFFLFFYFFWKLVTWEAGNMGEREKDGQSWVDQIVDPRIGRNYEASKMEILVKVALDCVEEDKDVRMNFQKRHTCIFKGKVFSELVSRKKEEDLTLKEMSDSNEDTTASDLWIGNVGWGTEGRSKDERMELLRTMAREEGGAPETRAREKERERSETRAMIWEKRSRKIN